MVVPIYRPDDVLSVRKSRALVAVALWVTAAFVVLMALDASARNGLLHESAVQKASDRFERQMNTPSRRQ